MGFIYGSPVLKKKKSSKRNVCFDLWKLIWLFLLAFQPCGQVYFITGTCIHNNLSPETIVLTSHPLDTWTFLLKPSSDNAAFSNMPPRDLGPRHSLLKNLQGIFLIKLANILAFVWIYITETNIIVWPLWFFFFFFKNTVWAIK